METILKSNKLNENLNEAIKTAKLEYQSDISWGFENTTNKNCIAIDFFQDETGANHVEQFCIKVNKVWIDILPTDEQVKMMWKMLNDTPYRESEKEEFDKDFNGNQYEYCGVTQKDFY